MVFRFAGLDRGTAETWLGEWSDQAMEQADRAMSFLEQVARVSVSATSRDGAVTVRVDASGNIVDLTLADAVRGWEPATIAQRVLAVMRQAQSRLIDGVRAAADGTVGADSDAGRAAIAGYTERFPAPEAEPPGWPIQRSSW